jgi:hypothetical protein
MAEIRVQQPIRARLMAKKPAVNPWDAPELDDYDLRAIKAVAAGKASEGQQQLAIKVIVETIAATYDLPYRPGGAEGARATDFAAGKMFVGQRIVNAIKRPLKADKAS